MTHKQMSIDLNVLSLYKPGLYDVNHVGKQCE